GTPNSRSTTNLAGSAPDRAGVIAPPKSPPNDTRSAVGMSSGIRIAAALNRIFMDRDTSSIAAAAKHARCAHSGSATRAPSSDQLDRMMYADAPNANKNEIAVRI